MTTTKHITTFISGLIILTLTSCNGQTSPTEKLYLKDFKFNSYFGYQNGDKNTSYCLLGQGFFRTPRSTNSDSLLNGWLAKHPDAIVVKVSSMATPEKSNPNLNLTYCWIIDNTDTLNNYLIRQGCYPGGTMQRPQTWKEMSSKEKELYEDTDKPKVTVHIDKKTYASFIEQIKSAEIYARGNRLGIWAKTDNEGEE